MGVQCKLYLGEDKVRVIIDALRSSKGDQGASAQERSIANFLETELRDAKELADAQDAARLADDQRRAARADGHVLTERQAACLASIRAGKGPYEVPYSWTDRESGAVKWAWRRSRSMGGATSRMVDTLIEEGLIRGRELTDGGRRRLEGYEQKHGHVGP